MYPTIDEPEIYAANGHTQTGSVLPHYGIPQASAPPYIMRAHYLRTQEWSTHLFHCLDDPAICFVTCCCPCITFGHIAEIVNKGTPTCASSGATYGVLALTGLACLYSCNYRSKMRAQFDLPEAPCMDCLVHFCCEACALCQEYRQLRNLGFDLSIDNELRYRMGSQHGKTKAWGYSSSRNLTRHDKMKVKPIGSFIFLFWLPLGPLASA